jgi:carbon-monoxide dehydrogenase medium subunit
VASLREAARILVDLADPVDDVRGSAEYRLMLIPRLLAQAVQEVERPA